jgi:hypothetical protein
VPPRQGRRFCFEGLTEDGINTDNWDTVKAEFLETYEPKYSAKTTCANFTDLSQKSEETINDYTYRIQMAYKRLTDKKPAAMAAVHVNITAGATEAEIKAEGVTDAFKFIKHQLFLASRSPATWKPSRMITRGSTASTPSSKS